MNVNFALLADRPEAIEKVAQWWFDEWGHLRPADHTAETVAAEIRSTLTQQELPIDVVAMDGDDVVGVAALKLQEMVSLYPDKQHWLGNVYVDPAYRGKGIASALSAKIAQIAESRGIKALHLQTEHLDGGLYAQLGWEPIEAVHHRGYDVLVMVKRLTPR